MKISWIGHSCFLIEGSKGKRILIDPVPDIENFDNLIDGVDIVTASHHHFDHYNIKPFLNKSIILDSCGYFDFNDIKIYGIPCYHDKFEGMKRGNNIIFVFELDNLRICHLGDLGHILSKDIIDKIGSINLLFIPVGGNFTLDGSEASLICKYMHSNLIIPMHYKNCRYSFLLKDASKFIMNMKNSQKSNNPIVLNYDEVIKENNKIIVLDPIIISERELF